MAKPIKVSTMFFIGALILFVIANIGTTTQDAEEGNAMVVESDWTMTYQQQAEENEILAEDFAKTSYYDTDSLFIQAVASGIIQKSDTPKEAIKNALEFVYYSVEYNSLESDSSCIYGVGSEIIQSGSGQCDTQSISVITILRAMGIASKPVGGCLYQTPCGIQSIFQPRMPQFAETEPGDLSRAGWLHAWVEAWTPEDGWLTLEATNGLIANNDCWGYEVEMYPANDDKYHICLAESQQFAMECRVK